LALVAVVGGVACHDTSRSSRFHHKVDGGPGFGPPDAGPDAGPGDAGPSDAGPTDAGIDAGPVDAGPPDAGPPDAGPRKWSGAWERFGPPLGNEAQVYPAMALDPSGTLLVAYVQLVELPGEVDTELRVVRWSGSAWQQLGPVVTSSSARLPYSAPLFIGLATDGDGRPVLAFGDSGPGASIGAFPLKTWTFDDTAWQQVPVPVSAPQLSGIALARAADGQVRLVLSTGEELHVLVLGASDWTEAAPTLVHDAGISEPDLAMTADGTPLIAFSAAESPGSFGTLHAFRGSDAGWTDLGLPSPSDDGLLFHTPRIRERADGGAVVAASEWQYDPMGKIQVGVGVPVFALGVGGWSMLDDDGPPGGFALSEPIPGSPVDLLLEDDVPVVVSTGADAGVSLRALAPDGIRPAPVLGGVGAGTLIELLDGGTLVGAVLPVSHDGPVDGGQVQLFHFTGAPAGGAAGLGPPDQGAARRSTGVSVPGPSAAAGSR
jgi:hypothetical protein